MSEKNEDDVQDAASTLSKRGASRGGQSRARKLSPEERREIAKRAAAARWGESVQVATHSGDIVIGDLTISCAVLEDGTRVLSQSTVLSALGRNPDKARRSRGSEGELRAPFLAADNLQPFISPELQQFTEPIAYRDPQRGPGRSWGYRAELLPLVCDLYLEARAAGKLVPAQQAVAKSAEILVRGLARIGIVALVDEATGYQETRAKFELQQILNLYVQAELRPWTKRFPDEFFKEIYRLQGWEYKPGTAKRTPYVGTLINKYIYEQLPHGVLDELRTLNPVTEKGYRRHKHFQHLTADTGNVHLDRQISTVTTLLRIARNKADFEDLFERAFPPAAPRLPLVLDPPKD